MSTNTEKEKKENDIEVAVVTTSGSFPEEGFEKVSIHQKVMVILKKAQEKLKIVSTDKWVAKVGGRIINPDSSYVENNLSGTITIDYGPSEGGGGV